MIATTKIEGGVKGLLFFLLISNLFFSNGLYLFYSMAVLFIGFYYLQQPYKPAVFTVIFFYHFLQIIAGVWQATYLGYDLDYRSVHMGTATIISLVGLVILFIPIIYFQNKIPKLSLDALRSYADRLSINKAYYAYII